MKIKKAYIIILVIVAILLIGVISFMVTMGKYSSAYNHFDFSDINLNDVADGTYIGNEDGGLVKASVEVTVKDHAITQIDILSHDCGTGAPAEVIVDDMLATNSLDVDTISGATFSSNVIKMATYNALFDR